MAEINLSVLGMVDFSGRFAKRRRFRVFDILMIVSDIVVNKSIGSRDNSWNIH